MATAEPQPQPQLSLTEILADLYTTQGDILRVLGEAQIAPYQFNLNDKPINIWTAILERARESGSLWALMRIPLSPQEYGMNAALQQAWEREVASRRQQIAVVRDRQGGVRDDATIQSIILDLVWETRDEQKELRKQVSELRHESRGAIGALQLIVQGQGIAIKALQERPEQYLNRWFVIAVIALGFVLSLLGEYLETFWRAFKAALLGG